MMRITYMLLLAVIASLPGCSSKSDSSAKSDKEPATKVQDAKGVIGVSVLTMTNPFFKVIAEGITDEASKHGYETIVTSGEFDVAKQQNQVKDFIVSKVAAIALSPCDSRSIGAVIQEANEAGVPVFTFDIACLEKGAKVVTHIATDNYGGGKQAGEAMIEALGGEGGKVVILDFKQAESCILRVDGFKEVIAAHNESRDSGTVEIVAELPGDGQKDKGYKAAEDALQSHPDIRGIFAINDPSALGARAALEKANKTDQVIIVGFDGQPEGKQAIKDGKIYADPVQYPEQIAQQTVATIMKYFDGEDVPAELLIPTGLYRQADGEQDAALK